MVVLATTVAEPLLQEPRSPRAGDAGEHDDDDDDDCAHPFFSKSVTVTKLTPNPKPYTPKPETLNPKTLHPKTLYTPKLEV